MNRRSGQRVARGIGVLGLWLWLGACGGDEAAPKTGNQGLPCEVERIVVERCQGCHGDPTTFGAPMPLVDAEDFHAPAVSDSSKKVYRLVSGHLHGKTSLMPPLPNVPLTKAELSTFDAWLKDGAPAAAAEETCDEDAAVAPTAGAVYAASAEPPDDCEEFHEFRAHAPDAADEPYEVAAELKNTGNEYTCFYFTPPYGEDAAALWLHSLVDNTRVLHHWILYGTESATKADGSVAPCSAAESNAFFIAGWAPGGGDFVLPSNVAMDLPRGPNAGLILEVHYYNSGGKVAKDNSGVRLCTAKQKSREHLAAVHFTGSEGICLDPGEKSTVTGMCDPRDDQGDIHILGVWPHMHKAGRRMRVTILRKDGGRDVIHDESFDFESQIYYPQPNDKWVLHPGDRLKTDCVYENDGTSQIHFGERTQDEMCYGFITSWPAGALANDPNDLLQVVGGPFQQQNRCLDPVSIAASCNGLNDFPQAQ